MSLLCIRHFSLSILAHPIITQLNLQVQLGELWCVLGRNGAGKTTLLKKIAGLPSVSNIDSTGEILLNDIPLERHSQFALAQLRAYAAAKWHPHLPIKVIDWLAASCWPKRSQSSAVAQHARISQVLQDCHLAALAQRNIESLSDGEQQRVALAACIGQDVPLLLLDEPMAHLDLAYQLQLMQLIRQYCAQKKIAAMVSLHDIHLARQGFTHALVMLAEGNWIAGTAAQVLRPDVLAQAFGISPAIFSRLYGI